MLEGNFQVQAPPPPGAYIWRGDLTRVFCVTSLGGLYLEGLIFGILRYLDTTLFEMLASLSSIKLDETFHVKGFTLPW